MSCRHVSAPTNSPHPFFFAIVTLSLLCARLCRVVDRAEMLLQRKATPPASRMAYRPAHAVQPFPPKREREKLYHAAERKKVGESGEKNTQTHTQRAHYERPKLCQHFNEFAHRTAMTYFNFPPALFMPSKRH